MNQFLDSLGSIMCLRQPVARLVWVLSFACAINTFVQAGEGLAPFQITCVDEDATGYGTFQSHNRKVLANANGIFMTHIRSRNEPYTAQQWRLSRSTDGGRSFQTVYEATN